MSTRDTPLLVEACAARKIPLREFYTMPQVARLTRLTLGWIYKQVKKEARPTIYIDGTRVMAATDLEAWLAYEEQKDEAVKERATDPYSLRRPSNVAVKMISRKVCSDSTLTPAEKEKFLGRLQAYLAEWQSIRR